MPQRRTDSRSEKHAAIQIEALHLSPSAYSSLKRAGIDTVEHLVNMSVHDLMTTRLDAGALAEVREKLAAFRSSRLIPNHLLPREDLQASQGESSFNHMPTSHRPPSASQDPTLCEKPISVLDLSTRSHNGLMRAGIFTIGRLVQMSADQILTARGIGEKTVAEIQRKLQAYVNDSPSEQSDSHRLLRPSFHPLASQISGTDGTPITALKLSPRVQNALIQAGITNIGTLAHMSLRQVGDAVSIGGKMLAEVREKMKEYSSEPPASDQICEEQWTIPGSTPINILGMSVRSYNALARHGVTTIEQLAQMSTEQILDIRNLGERSLAEIQERLETYLVKYPLPTPEPIGTAISEPPIPLVTPELLAGFPQSLLENISVDRLALPIQCRDQLLRQGIKSLGELAQQSANAIDQSSLISNYMVSYLAWLGVKDKATWADEISQRGISPLHRMILDGQTLEALIAKWLSCLTEREAQVIQWRHGLRGHQLTLEDVGQHLGVTRQRARQLQVKAQGKLKRPSDCEQMQPLMALLTFLLTEAGGLMNLQQIGTALRRELTVGDVDPVGAAQLALELDDSFKWFRRTFAWGLAHYPTNRVDDVQKRLARLLTEHRTPTLIGELLDRFKATRFFQGHRDELSDTFIIACLQVHPEIEINEEMQCALTKWSGKRLDEMVLALRKLGEPAHYSVIAEHTNALLPPEQQAAVHNIHAQMQRLSDIFVRVGHGIYGLAEWGLHQDGCLADAAYRVLREVGRPLNIDAVADEVLKTWRVRPSSVYMAMENDTRFIRIGAGVYCLQEQIKGEAVEQPQIDFGDLFSARLARWQVTLNQQQGSCEFDTHAEVDTIKDIGLDFFE